MTLLFYKPLSLRISFSWSTLAGLEVLHPSPLSPQPFYSVSPRWLDPHGAARTQAWGFVPPLRLITYKHICHVLLLLIFHQTNFKDQIKWLLWDYSEKWHVDLPPKYPCSLSCINRSIASASSRVGNCSSPSPKDLWHNIPPQHLRDSEWL